MFKGDVFMSKIKRIIAMAVSAAMLFAFSAYIPVSALTSADLSISQNGIEFICSLEGFHSTCYVDSTQSSIGYGTKCTGSSVQPHTAGSHSITREQAMSDMKSQIESTYSPRVRTQTSGITMNQNQFDALVSLCYNCGGGTSRISNSPLVKYLKGELTESEARSQYSSYIVTSGGSVLQGLINRRNKEADLFFTPDATEPPTYAKVTLEKRFYTTDENVTFILSSDTGICYTIGIDDADGNRIDTYDTADSSYTRTFSTPGNYSCYITTYNNYGLADSERIYFTIYDSKPGYAKVYLSQGTLSQNVFMVGEEVTFNLTSDTGTCYTVGIDDTDGNRIDTYDTDSSSYTRIFETPGNYSCYITTYNDFGLADSERIYFTIYDSKPNYAKVTLSQGELLQNVFMIGEEVTFNLSSDTGVTYTVGIDDANGNRIDTYDTREKSYIRSFDIAGNYSCYITTYNGMGFADSERVYFTIYDSKPDFAEVSLNKNVYFIGEEVDFILSSNTGVTYTVGIDDSNGNRIDTYDTRDSSYTRTFDTAGSYSCYITTYNGLGLTDSERIYFYIISEYGDLTQDNATTITDAVALQKYLLAIKTLTAEQKAAADMNSDGRVNIFDLNLLKAALK